MASTSKGPQDERANQLRLKIKKWEHEFASLNGGRKPSQSDIRKDSKIASKYREYHKLRHATRLPGSQAEYRSPQRRRNGSPIFPVDGRGAERPNRLGKFLNTESIKATPQKNGKILGIFDSVVYSGAIGSPSRGLASPSRASRRIDDSVFVNPLPPPNAALSAPSKSATGTSDGCKYSPSEYAITTPSKKRKRTNDMGSPDAPSKHSHDDFSTPRALRYDRLSPATYADSPEASLCLPKLLPRKPPLRGLTSMLAELRKAEDEVFADEEEALRDMQEGGMEADACSDSKSTLEVDVQEGSQSGTVVSNQNNLHSAPITAHDTGDITSTGSNKSNVSSSVIWKKKGLKRQTKRSILRPIAAPINNDASQATKQPPRKRKTNVAANFKKLKLKSGGKLRERFSRGFRRNK